jgi:hypothetical protein
MQGPRKLVKWISIIPERCVEMLWSFPKEKGFNRSILSFYLYRSGLAISYPIEQKN